MNRLIQDYLRARGVRYFRGHHDDEYFYLVDFVLGAHRGRLNVHLEVSGAGRDSVLINITPDRYYPVSLRERLQDILARWNAGTLHLQAALHDSCDPGLVGVLAHGCFRPADAAALADHVDAAVGSSIELFGSMPGVAALRDAG
ncbi:MAG: hypothetical protein KIH64_001520 [Mycobacterium sp.]|nr:hypothetical protein [Mycobacterium sp.]